MNDPSNASVPTKVPLSTLIVDEADNRRIQYNNIEELASSIKADGLISPITVIEDGKQYRVIAGFRRAKAMRHAGVEEATVIVRKDLDRRGVLFLQFAENMYRNDLTPFETASALKRLVDEFSLTRRDLAERLNVSLAWLSNYLGVYDLPPAVQEMVKDNKLGVAHIRFLHAQQKHVDATDVDELAEKIQGMGQAELTQLRERLEAAGPRGVTDSVAETKTTTVEQRSKQDDEQDGEPDDVTATASAATEVDTDDTEPLAPLKTRARPDILAAINRINERADGITNKAATAKLVGQVEALQWVLGDDTIEL